MEKIERVDIDAQEIEALLKCAKEALPEQAYTKIEQIVRAYLTMMHLVEDRKTTIARLRRMLFGASTESLDNVLKTLEPQPAGKTDTGEAERAPEADKSAAKGHGRNGASEYSGAQRVKVAHVSLSIGQRCPGCLKGKLYDCVAPGVLVRVTGQAPLAATVYELQKLRCNLCGEVFTAEPPAGIGTEKYDAGAGAMIALLKYGSGLPFNRLAQLQEHMGLPLPAATQWEIVDAFARVVKPAHAEMIEQAAQGAVLHNDDTNAQILELVSKSGAATKQQGAQSPPPGTEEGSERSGIFTSGIVAVTGEHKIALFYTGHKHAGENLLGLLKKRSQSLAPPIQMCDALSRNMPKALQTIVANCASHARRKFVDVAVDFPDECRHVLEVFKAVYAVDAAAKEQNLSATARLALHQAESAPLMTELFDWMKEQVAAKKVEPNSGLGQAIGYMRKHWQKLTLFLRVPGAPLDNNLCERALKKAILHRKNSLFYKTLHGAEVGDLFMSLIHTCQLCHANPFEYLVALHAHQLDFVAAPSAWMPWNYRQTMGDLASQVPAVAP